ncbi:hypothetical protein LTR62_005128 [Meristemomyces frigidus]|uniref:TauD/TfdA-like domain-containing protein n=1 Tax=Meristemomyces frigidus TaxID=1508187 RepID=A0AAN7TWV9_9PEZI|nr:hypothetical protein LTR62_005128 [Meristemomyces frigidus]
MAVDLDERCLLQVSVYQNISRISGKSPSTKVKVASAASTKYKLTPEYDPWDSESWHIPDQIRGEIQDNGPGPMTISWTNDIPGYDPSHKSFISPSMLEHLFRLEPGKTNSPSAVPERVHWTCSSFRDRCPDFRYEQYMGDDSILIKALNQLHRYGLVFVEDVPGIEQAVTEIVERIGPLKNTFYGRTWDVRSVPQAKNVAYTAQDLGFHMDLMYMQQPPHLQFLHCIRSSSAGGASLFTDSIRAARDLWKQDPQAVQDLAQYPVNFHYDHPETHYYHQERRVFEFDDKTAIASGQHTMNADSVASSIKHVSWAPPFQGPFRPQLEPFEPAHTGPVQRWHAAAKKFNAAIHQPEGIYERMMKPGECVIFDNRRVLHARKAFEVGDVGKERWLRGAYMDEDPFLSKSSVLHHRARQASQSL